jgi:hypothetical protein
MNWKECGTKSNLMSYTHICQEGLRKTMKNFCQDSLCHG